VHVPLYTKYKPEIKVGQVGQQQLLFVFVYWFVLARPSSHR
jgi:hypothetical protein